MEYVADLFNNKKVNKPKLKLYACVTLYQPKSGRGISDWSGVAGHEIATCESEAISQHMDTIKIYNFQGLNDYMQRDAIAIEIPFDKIEKVYLDNV